MEEIKKVKKVYEYSPEKIKQYNENFKTRHQNEKIFCDICNCEYFKLSSSYHPKSKYHIIAEKIRASLGKDD